MANSCYQRPVYLIDGARTPFLKARKPGPFYASDLAVHAGKALLLRQDFGQDAIDEVIMGCVMAGAKEANIARLVAMRLGCHAKTPAYTVARNCASGMQALDNAALSIASGRSDLVLTGGMEAMSHAPVLWSEEFVSILACWGRANTKQRLTLLTQLRPKLLKPIISLLLGLTDPLVGLSMGQTAENLAYRFNISRMAMDQFSLNSHQRVAAAWKDNRFTEVVTLYDSKGQCYEQDDGFRSDTDISKFAERKAVFDRPDGNITAANSSQVTDGAALLLLASEQAVEKYKLEIMAELKDTQWAGLDPAEMGLGPVHAMTPIMQRQSLQLADLDYWEINEAFAAQVLACVAAWKDESYCRKLGLDTPLGEIEANKLNVNGGAIALGHPVGASGARIVLHLVHVLKAKNARLGMASLCIGGGQGGAMLIEVESK